MTENPLVAGSIYREMRERIISGQYPPGMVLRQQDIAEQFATSRVPLREAFSKLEAEGFLTLRQQRGYAVSQLDADDLTEIFDLRAVMERHAGQIATRMQKPGDAQALEAIAEALFNTETETAAGMAQWSDLNCAFHDRMFACSQRPRLQQTLRQMRDQVEAYVRMELGLTQNVTETTRDHEEIVSAFRSGDADLVGELCAVHCSRTARRLLEAYPHLPLQGSTRRA